MVSPFLLAVLLIGLVLKAILEDGLNRLLGGIRIE